MYNERKIRKLVEKFKEKQECIFFIFGKGKNYLKVSRMFTFDCDLKSGLYGTDILKTGTRVRAHTQIQVLVLWF